MLGLKLIYVNKGNPAVKNIQCGASIIESHVCAEGIAGLL